MKLVSISTICISSLLLLNCSIIPQATAQCLTRNDDTSQLPTHTDLSDIQDFHFQLFRDIIPTDVKRNFIFSPYSVWSALTLAYFGASGRTEDQLRQILRHQDKVTALKKWRAVEYEYNRRPKDSVGSTFISANRAYFDTRIRLNSCIQDILQNEVEKVDFTKSQEAANYINDFVSQTTKGNIKDLVTPDVVDRARLVLVNAAYFKGVWEKTFNKRDTRPATFTGLDGTQYNVDMMQQKGRFKFGYDDQLKTKYLELPYSGKSTSMILFLPYKNTQENFNTMIRGLSNRKFEEVIGGMILADIEVDLPKFKMDTIVGDELLQTLASMGITDAFDLAKADFATFSQDRQLNLDKSIQKAFIDVNEEGTEAAAATGFIGTKSGGTSSFECNRPFMFVIRDIDTKNILFMGAYKSSDKIDQSIKSNGEQDRNNNFPAKENANTNYFSPNPVYSGQFFPTINKGNQNVNPLPNSNLQNYGFSHGHQSSSPDRIFSSLQQSGGSAPVKNQDRHVQTFDETNGSNSGAKKINQDVFRTELPPVGNSGSLPSRDSNQNFGQTFTRGERLPPSSNQNFQPQGESFRPIPSRGGSPSLQQNIPSVRENSELNPGRDVAPNSNQNIHSGGVIVQGQQRNNPSLGDFISDKVVTQSINQNIPSSDGNHQTYQSTSSNRIPEVPDQNFINFEENRKLIQGGEKTQSSDRNNPLLEKNKEFIPSRGVTQSSERNIPSSGNHKVNNQTPNQNIPTFEFTGQVVPNVGSFQRPNQYIYALGGITPVIVRPQNLIPTLFEQNNGLTTVWGSNESPDRQIPFHVGYSGIVPGRDQNGPNNGFASVRGSPQIPNHYISFR